jgi:hypothetical protein
MIVERNILSLTIIVFYHFELGVRSRVRDCELSNSRQGSCRITHMYFHGNLHYAE